MHSISSKSYVLVEALLYIAFNTDKHPLGGKKLANILNVPPRYLEPLMQSLVRRDLLKSIRGPRGGYMLAVQPELLRMDDVMLALEQERQERNSKAALEFSRANQKLVQPLFECAEDAYLATLGKVTLKDLTERARQEGLDADFICDKKAQTPKMDYII